MPKGGHRKGAGRPSLVDGEQHNRKFRIEPRLKKYLTVLGEGNFSAGTRQFINLCRGMAESVKQFSPPYPNDLVPLLPNLQKLNQENVGEEHAQMWRDGTIGVSVRITHAQFDFLNTVGNQNARRGFRRLDNLIYTTLGGVDMVTMGRHPKYAEIWKSYEVLFNGYARTVHQDAGRIPGRGR